MVKNKIDHSRLIAYIRRNWKNMLAEDMAEELDISHSALKTHAQRANITVLFGECFRPKEIEIKRRRAWLKKYGAGLTLREIAKGLGIPRTTAYSFCRQEEYEYKNRVKPMVRKQKMEENGMFVIEARENWLI